MWYDGSQNDEYIYSHIAPDNRGYIYTHITTHTQVISQTPPLITSANKIYTVNQLGITPSIKMYILTY